ncbi:MAG: hypothetical protein DRI77_05915 [Chloroflexi bacterium]|nr:MAG: hypothetical protein DRI77_05915 [Chloroflexota bacterium]
MNQEKENQVREYRAPYTTTAETAVEEHIPGPLIATLSPLSPRVRQVVQIIQEFKFQERDQFFRLLPTLLNISSEDYGWLKIAESAFEFWDNEEDAIYDQL